MIQHLFEKKKLRCYFYFKNKNFKLVLLFSEKNTTTKKLIYI